MASIKTLYADRQGRTRYAADGAICAAARRGSERDLSSQTNDAGAFFRFTDTYSKVVGGQLALAMEPPTVEPSAKEGLINVRDFSIKGEAALDRAAAGGPAGAQSGVSFSALRAEFTRQSGQLTIREGVVKGPTIGATIEGSIDTSPTRCA